MDEELRSRFRRVAWWEWAIAGVIAAALAVFLITGFVELGKRGSRRGELMLSNYKNYITVSVRKGAGVGGGNRMEYDYSVVCAADVRYRIDRLELTVRIWEEGASATPPWTKTLAGSLDPGDRLEETDRAVVTYDAYKPFEPSFLKNFKFEVTAVSGAYRYV